MTKTAGKNSGVYPSGGGLLSKLIPAAGDYLAILAAEWAALTLRNFFMTYSVYHVSPVYFFFITPFIFLSFLFVNRLYSGKLLL